MENNPIISLKNISKDYNTATTPVHALKNVNLDINQGEFVSIIGPSGSGKSTMLNILGLLDLPTFGVYEFDGQDTSKLKNNQIAQLRGSGIGFVFQAFHLIKTKTVLDNVALSGVYQKVPKKNRVINSVDAIKKVGLDKRTNFLTSNLSGGEMQRVAIARAIAHKPKVLLCDEPTGNLDTKNSFEIVKLLKEMHENGLTIIIITHNSDVASSANRIVNVKDGLVY